MAKGLLDYFNEATAPLRPKPPVISPLPSPQPRISMPGPAPSNRLNGVLDSILNTAKKAAPIAKAAYGATPLGQTANATKIFMNKRVRPDLPSIGESIEATAPTVAQDFAKTLRKPFENTNIPLVKGLSNMAANTGEAIGSGATDIVRGVKDIGENKLPQAAAKLFFGGGKIAAAQTPVFQVANLSTQNAYDPVKRVSAGVIRGQTGIDTLAPDVKNKTMKVGPWDIDPAEMVGKFVGFVNNPSWKKIYPITSKLLGLKVAGENAGKLGAVTNFLVQRISKGGLEGLVQAVAQLPPNASQEDYKNAIKTVLFGAASEVAFDTVQVGGKAILEKTGLKEQAEKAIDTLAREWRAAWTPVSAYRDAVGNATTRPMWLEQLTGNGKGTTPDVLESSYKVPDIDVAPEVKQQLNDALFNGDVKKAQEILDGAGVSIDAKSLIRGGDQWGNTEIGRTQTDGMVARERFDIPNLKKISGGGSDRDVYDLGDGKVLKVAKTARGLSQNDVGGDYVLEDAGLTPKMFERGKNYIVVEKVGPPDINTKKMVSELKKFTYQDWENHSQELQETLTKYGLDDAMNYNVMHNDFAAIRNWGTNADGKPVHLDEGSFNSGVIDDYKGKKNLNDPDFRDAYYQSRAAKKKFGDTDMNTMYSTIKVPDVEVKDTSTPTFKDPEIQKTLDEVMGPFQGQEQNLKDLESSQPVVPKYTGEEQTQALGTSQIQTENPGLFDKIFAKWIGKRDAAKTVSYATGKKVADIPVELGPEVIKAIEDPSISITPEVDAYIKRYRGIEDQLYQEAKDAGIPVDYLKNHISHIWNRDEDEVVRMYADYKSANPGFQFAKDRVFPTYEEGKAMGLVPKYTQPAQILAEYTRKLEQSKANLDFLTELKDKGIVVDAAVGSNQNGFAPINATGFPKSQAIGANGEKIIQGQFYAPQEVADTINRVFNSQDTGLLGKTANLAGKVQDLTLSGGIPYTPVNSFAIMNGVKDVLSGRITSPVTSFFRSLSGGASKDFFEENVDTIVKMQQHNIPVSTMLDVDELVPGSVVNKTIGGKLGDVWQGAMNERTFKRFLPMMQINLFNDIEDQMISAGKNSDEASEIAAQVVRNFYGQAGTDAIAKRSQLSKDVVSTVFFAPRFRESMVNFWVNNAKSLLNPTAIENRQNVKFVVGSTIALGSMNYLNEVFNGHGMLENPPGTEDKLLIPLSKLTGNEADQTVVGIPFLSSISTIPRALFREGKMLLEGDVSGAVSDAAKTLPSSLIKPFGEIAANKDYFDRPIVEDNDTPQERLVKMGKHIFASYNHPYIKELITESYQDDPLYQRVSRATEVPFRYYTTKSLEGKEYFQIRDEVMRGLANNDRQVFDNLHKAKTLDEDGLPVYDKRSEMAAALQRLANPGVVQAEAKIAFQSAEKNGDPINPFYLLTPKQQETVLVLKTFYPGDKQKGQVTNANREWLQPYWDAREQYFNQLKAKGVIDDKSFAYPRIEVTPQLSNKLDTYFKLPTGTGLKSMYLRANPDLQKYFDANHQLTNDQRAELSLPLLPDYGSGGGGPKLKKAGKIKLAKTKVAKSRRFKMPKGKSLASYLPKAKKVKIEFSKKQSKNIDYVPLQTV